MKQVNCNAIIKELFNVIKARQRKMPNNSYTVELLTEGIEKIAQKVGEEAVETVIAAVSKNKKNIKYEMADLCYHCLVLLAAAGLSPEDITKELKKRFNKKRK